MNLNKIALISLISCLQLSQLAAMEAEQIARIEISNFDESKTDLFFPLPQEIVAHEIFKGILESSENLKDLWKNVKSFEKLSKYVKSEIYKKNLSNLVIKQKKEILEKIWELLWNKFRFERSNNLDDINCTNIHHETALGHIIYPGFLNTLDTKNTIELLIRNGIDIESTNTNGDTALIWASRNGYLDTVQFLLNSGANINVKNKNNVSALLSAVLSCPNETKKQVLETLINNGANINDEDDDKYTALILASTTLSHDSVKLLLDKGAEINGRTKMGFTALSEAVGCGRVENVKILIERGADLDIVYQGNKTVFDIANQYRDDKGEAIIKLLEQYSNMQLIKNKR